MSAKTKKTVLTVLKNILAWIISLIMLDPSPFDRDQCV